MSHFHSSWVPPPPALTSQSRRTPHPALRKPHPALRTRRPPLHRSLPRLVAAICPTPRCPQESAADSSTRLRNPAITAKPPRSNFSQRLCILSSESYFCVAQSDGSRSHARSARLTIMAKGVCVWHWGHETRCCPPRRAMTESWQALARG